MVVGVRHHRPAQLVRAHPAPVDPQLTGVLAVSVLLLSVQSKQLSKRVRQPKLIAATGLLLLATPFGGLNAPTWRADALAALLVLGIIGTGIAYVINYRIITDDGPVLASTVTYLLPIVAVILGWLVVNEPITIQLAIVVAIVLAGVALTRRKPDARLSRTSRIAESGS